MLDEILMRNKRLLHFPYIKKYSLNTCRIRIHSQRSNTFATTFQAGAVGEAKNCPLNEFQLTDFDFD